MRIGPSRETISGLIIGKELFLCFQLNNDEDELASGARTFSDVVSKGLVISSESFKFSVLMGSFPAATSWNDDEFSAHVGSSRPVGQEMRVCRSTSATGVSPPELEVETSSTSCLSSVGEAPLIAEANCPVVGEGMGDSEFGLLPSPSSAVNTACDVVSLPEALRVSETLHIIDDGLGRNGNEGNASGSLTYSGEDGAE